MFSQYRNKIIALFLTVCLLVTSLCVPVGAADNQMFLYNGVMLPAIPDVSDPDYTFKIIALYEDGYRLHFVDSDGYAPYYSGSKIITAKSGLNYFLTYKLENGEWIYVGGNSVGKSAAIPSDCTSETRITVCELVWANRSVYDAASWGNVVLPYSEPVPVGSGSSVGTMTYYTGHFGSDFSNTTYHVDGLADSDTYFIRGYCYQDSSLVVTVDSPAWTGPGTYCTVEFSGLSSSTTYDFEFVLYVNDEETSVTDTKSVTTLAVSSEGGDSEGGDGTGDGGGTSGGCTECPSILSAILSAITNQSTFFADWKQDWLSRMDSLEEAIVTAVAALTPVPDPTETALKESVKETTQAVVDEVFADDAPTKVTVSDVKDVAEIGSAASSMFDSGVSVGSFFDALNNIRFIAFFSQETYDDLNTVQSPVTYSLDDESGYVDYYSENMDKIQQFVGGE